MLPDLSPAHIFLFVVVTLIVVGPKELPSMLRKVGLFMGRMRSMANEFRASFDEMARQSELDELRREVEAMRAAAGKPVSDLQSYMDPVINVSPDDATAFPAAIAEPAEEAHLDALPPVAAPAEAEPVILPPSEPAAPHTKAKAKTKALDSEAKPRAPKKPKAKVERPAEPEA